MAKAAVFLDRDGTLLEDVGYLDRLERLVFLPYTIDAVRLLNRAGFAVVVVTNQAGIARGIVQESFVSEAHRYIADRFAAGGARVDGFYYCPHHTDGIVEEFRRDCNCRKPKPGMLRRAAADLDLGLDRSFAVGDRWHDLEAGQIFRESLPSAGGVARERHYALAPVQEQSRAPVADRTGDSENAMSSHRLEILPDSWHKALLECGE